MVDHLRNSAGVGLEDLQVLVLDEADRLLEMGFAEEVGSCFGGSMEGSACNRNSLLRSLRGAAPPAHTSPYLLTPPP